jgi:hypothetical protein
LTPIYPAVNVSNSKNHHSAQIIKVAGIAILKYIVHPFNASLSGIKIASEISGFRLAYKQTALNYKLLVMVLARPTPNNPQSNQVTKTSSQIIWPKVVIIVAIIGIQDKFKQVKNRRRRSQWPMMY